MFKVLAISFAYPPLAYPRSIQVARLLKHLRSSTVLVCGNDQYVRRDPTLEPNPELSLKKCLRVPFSVSRWRNLAGKIAHRLRLPVWGRIPDQYRSWTRLALMTIEDLIGQTHYVPDIVVSFGAPMSDHLIGLEIKRRYGLPWVAHFSDPWVDNPFNGYDPLTRAINRSLERQVVEAADALIFTSDETVDLVMAKYDQRWTTKAHVVPHAFDPSLYPAPSKHSNVKLTIRHVGDFYGHRSPKPLFEALQGIHSRDPIFLEHVCFEFIGSMRQDLFGASDLNGLHQGLVVIRPPVNYRESLLHMLEADGLLVVDAPAKQSVFLPSKLIEYIGSGRPILCLSPRGTAATLVGKLGGWVADPDDSQDVMASLRSFISFLRQNGAQGDYSWGDPTVRDRYHVSVVAKLFEDIIQKTLLRRTKS